MCGKAERPCGRGGEFASIIREGNALRFFEDDAGRADARIRKVLSERDSLGPGRDEGAGRLKTVSWKSFPEVRSVDESRSFAGPHPCRCGKEWLQEVRRDARSLILSLVAPDASHHALRLCADGRCKKRGHGSLRPGPQHLSPSHRRGVCDTEYLSMRGHVRSYAEIDRLIDRERIAMALVIPAGFERRFKSGKRNPDVQLITDGSDATTATVAIGYASAIIKNFNLDLKVRELARAGIREPKMPVEYAAEYGIIPSSRARNFLIPGLVVLLLAIISALIASLTISREWERGTMETLITTPVRGYELVLGKLIPYLIIGLFDVAETITLGYFVFDVPLRGSFVELGLVSLLFLAGTSSLGILISAATRVQVLSVQAAMVVTLPALVHPVGIHLSDQEPAGRRPGHHLSRPERNT